MALLTMVARGACSLLLVATLASPVSARSRPRARPRASGDVARVVYVAAGKAYIDRGTRHGLRLGTTLGSGPANRQCVVVAIADASAACAPSSLRLGDTLALTEVEKPPRVLAAPLRAEAVTEAARDAAANELAAAPVALVAYGGPSADRARRLGAEVVLSHDLWTQGDLGNRGYQRERLDIGLDARDLGVVGLSVHARLTAMRWTARPAQPRFRPDDDTQLYVWQGEVDYRPANGVTVAAGRLRPWALPGLAILDGAQVGYAHAATRLEAGVYGGGIPDTVTLAPRTSAWALGGYLTRDFRLAPSVFVAGTVRAGALQTAQGGMLATLGSELIAQLGRRASLGGVVVASADTNRLSAGHVDLWSAQLELRPADDLSMFAQARGETHAYYVLAEGTDHDTGMRFHTDAAVSWSASPWLAVSTTGGTTHDDGWFRAYVGPELRLQRILPLSGSAAVGYFKELGSLPAHTLYAQFGARPLARFSLWTRASYTVSDDRDLRNEAALSLAGSGAVTAWLSAGMSLMATYDNLDGQGSQPLGFLGRLWVSGRF